MSNQQSDSRVFPPVFHLFLLAENCPCSEFTIYPKTDYVYQGMVALFHHKFHDTSAHTSYLYFVKDLHSTDCISRSVPRTKNTTAVTLSDRRVVRLKLESNTNALVGRPLYVKLKISVNV